METALMFGGGSLVILIGWLIYVLFQTIIFGSLMGSCAASSVYIGSCVDSDIMFYVGNIGLTSTGLVACLLLVASFIFADRFWLEAKKAGKVLADPFGKKASSS